ncbi:hypothetical protein CMO83_03905 [Candidatus Woesearchaeota archaeon]|jgi:PHD/YefM family antitoxin component YafN of YafNO toxin-antitoxin module|nr:hypothetical protein [Candidatus Woesearchaeota archaeon]MAG91794.1 hypothetical protein [Candidatus Woesearchaeota archaeon]|tara:strand:- start:19373 stop:19561 length:189 start_codon:yes stop_codon:yes gene_type:complete
MVETIAVNKKAISDLVRIKEEFDAIVESIELMNNPEIQESIRKSKEDIEAGRVHKLKDVLKK